MSLPVVNAIEDLESSQRSQTAVFKDSVSRLQSSIRQGLALNRAVLVDMQTVIAQAFNVNQDMIELEKEKMRLAAEERIENQRDERSQPAPDKKDDDTPTTIKGSIFDTLKKVFGAAALVGAVTLVVKNWESIKAGFETIKPLFVKLKDMVVRVGEVVIPFLIENFETLAIGSLGVWAAFKAANLVMGIKAGITALKAGFIAAKASVIASAVAFAPVAAIAAGIALVSKGLYDAILAGKEKFDETGSMWLAIEEGLSQFIGTVIGFPIKLITDASAWVARQLGFEEFANTLGEFDPVGGIKETFRGLMRFIYDPETGKIFGIDFDSVFDSLPSVDDLIPDIKMPDFSSMIPDIQIPDFPNPFDGLGEKINNFDFSAFDFGSILGVDLNFGDKLKSLIGSMFGVETSVPSTVNPKVGATASGGVTGFQVQQASSQLVYEQRGGGVPPMVAAPVTVNTDNSSRINSQTITPATSRPNTPDPVFEQQTSFW